MGGHLFLQKHKSHLEHRKAAGSIFPRQKSVRMQHRYWQLYSLSVQHKYFQEKISPQQVRRLDIFEDGSFSIVYTSFKEYTGKKIIGDWNRSVDGENTFDLVERDGDFIQTVKLSDNGNYLTTYINGEELIFYKDNAEINIPLGADAGADEESFGGTWVTEYEGYNILLTVEDGNVKFSVLENPGNNAEAFGRSFVRSERYGSDTAFKRYYYDFKISDLEVGWENIQCHMFMMENGTIRLVAGDKFKRYFLIFEKI